MLTENGVQRAAEALAGDLGRGSNRVLPSPNLSSDLGQRSSGIEPVARSRGGAGGSEFAAQLAAMMDSASGLRGVSLAAASGLTAPMAPAGQDPASVRLAELADGGPSPLARLQPDMEDGAQRTMPPAAGDSRQVESDSDSFAAHLADRVAQGADAAVRLSRDVGMAPHGFAVVPGLFQVALSMAKDMRRDDNAESAA